MKLYGGRLSPFYERVYLQIKLKGLDDRIEFPGIPGGGIKSPEYLEISPLGKVPALADGDFCLPESMVICEYLEEKFPENPLLPVEPAVRARVRLIVRMVDLHILDALFALLGASRQGNIDESTREEKLSSIAAGLEVIERYMEGGSFAVGEDWTLADCALVPTFFFLTRFLPAMGADPFAGRPRLAEWHAAMVDTDIVRESDSAQQEAMERFLAERAREQAGG